MKHYLLFCFVILSFFWGCENPVSPDIKKQKDRTDLSIDSNPKKNNNEFLPLPPPPPGGN